MSTAHGTQHRGRRLLKGIVCPRDEQGMALLTVLVFSFIFLILTMTFFTVAGYEAGQAENRENSTRAFYLADGAIERAKAKLLDDGRWTAGYAKTGLDGGFYRLTIDTVQYKGGPHKRFYAEGFYGRTKRDVEVIADVYPASLGMAIYARYNIDLNGNICLDGYAHADGVIYDESHFDEDCGPRYDTGFGIDPPPAYVEPDSFPGATYYFVTANGRAGNSPLFPDTLFIKDRNWVTTNTYVDPDKPDPNFDWAYDFNSRLLKITIKNPAVLDQVAGPFKRLGSDSTVVINFAGKVAHYVSPGYPVHDSTRVWIQTTGGISTTIKSTIINTRYKLPMSNTSERLDKTRWMGGEIRTKTNATFEPTYCIAFLTQEIKGNASVELGTQAHPALSYIMDQADFSTGQWTIYGSIVSLGDIKVGGGVNLTFDRDFIDCLPTSLSTNWPEGASGVMDILRWREPPTRS